MSCNDHHHQSVTIDVSPGDIATQISLTSRRDKCGHGPLIELVHGFEIPANCQRYDQRALFLFSLTSHCLAGRPLQ